ncbi:Uncharacterized protein dnm_040210 [Desulfonema magnum]|uniref:Uncharacterized protein n=1 Tax=Desulfonema magnum TaxID=45655 RepID=A0A975BM44_9BACT|nr:Uncharacterized protein dnm_040210 [Desulfonema magnum]
MLQICRPHGAFPARHDKRMLQICRPHGAFPASPKSVIIRFLLIITDLGEASRRHCHSDFNPEPAVYAAKDSMVRTVFADKFH